MFGWRAAHISCLARPTRAFEGLFVDVCFLADAFWRDFLLLRQSENRSPARRVPLRARDRRRGIRDGGRLRGGCGAHG